MKFSKMNSGTVLNTQGCCFFCLKSDLTKVANKTPEVNFCANVEKQEKINLVSLRCFSRYLKINVDEPASASSIPTNFTEKKGIELNTDLKVYVCETCEQINSRFSYLFQQFEKIKMEMDFYLEKVHRRIFKSAKDSELVQNYSKKMTSDRETLTQLAFVDKLRKQIANKSVQRQRKPIVCLTETNVSRIATVKTEVDLPEAFDDDFEDLQENRDQFISFEANSQRGSCPSLASEIKTTPFKNISLSSKRKTLRKNEVTSKNDSSSVRYYFKKSATGKYQCTSCGKLFNRTEYAKNHYEFVHLKKTQKCEICNKRSYSCLASLKGHQLTCLQSIEKREKENPNLESKFVCDFCDKRFSTEYKIRKHRREVHENVNRYACNLCDRKFKKTNHLKKHKDVVHLGLRVSCGFCTKALSCKYILAEHEARCPQRLQKTE